MMELQLKSKNAITEGNVPYIINLHKKLLDHKKGKSFTEIKP